MSSSILLPCFVRIFITGSLNSLSLFYFFLLLLFISVLLIFSLEVLSSSFVCKVFLCLFILPNSLCVYFYIVDISTTFPSFERVPHVEYVLWGAVAQLPMVTLSGIPGLSPCRLWAPSCVWAVTAAGMLVCWTGPLQQEPFGGALMLFKTTHQVG